MSAQNFSLAMGEISDKYVNEAIAYHCEKKQPFSNRHKWLTRVACLFLVLLLSGGAVLTFSVEARAAFFGWVWQQYEAFYEYFFEGDADETTSAGYELAYAPEGFTFMTSFEIEGGETYLYSNEQGEIAQFSYSSNPSYLKIYVKTADYEHHAVTINGLPGDLYIASDNSEANELLWTDNANGTIFHISAPVGEAELVAMAEGVQS